MHIEDDLCPSSLDAGLFPIGGGDRLPPATKSGVLCYLLFSIVTGDTTAAKQKAGQ